VAQFIHPFTLAEMAIADPMPKSFQLEAKAGAPQRLPPKVETDLSWQAKSKMV
jgi:hypothetical protein